MSILLQHAYETEVSVSDNYLFISQSNQMDGDISIYLTLEQFKTILKNQDKLIKEFEDVS